MVVSYNKLLAPSEIDGSSKSLVLICSFVLDSYMRIVESARFVAFEKPQGYHNELSVEM